jgi:hypothetical protein
MTGFKNGCCLPVISLLINPAQEKGIFTILHTSAINSLTFSGSSLAEN